MDFNKFFDKVYIISLKDQKTKYNRVSSQFKKKNIKHVKFDAIDGRSKTKSEENEKRMKFEKDYDLKISKKLPLSAASLTIGTVLILRKMIEKDFNRILITEDDIVLNNDILKVFKQGVKELHHVDWHLLYLGCGGTCGNRDIGLSKTKDRPYKSTWKDVSVFVKHPYDLRMPCKSCEPFSKSLSHANQAGGTWAYAYSREFAQVFLDLLTVKSGKDKGKIRIRDHIDQILMKLARMYDLNILAFDPPIVMHEYGVARRDEFSTIKW
jgi:GR25 family glycosyltransferase involved in LPS biosynthesis